MKSNPDYKHKDKKRALLDEFCNTLGKGTTRKYFHLFERVRMQSFNLRTGYFVCKTLH